MCVCARALSCVCVYKWIDRWLSSVVFGLLSALRLSGSVLVLLFSLDFVCLKTQRGREREEGERGGEGRERQREPGEERESRF